MPHALITGAGIAGTAAAIALRKAGWDAEIFEGYERSDALRQGVFLTMAVNGIDALAAVDADDAVRNLGFPTGKIRFSTGAGKDLGAMAIGPKLVDGTVTRSMRRADLYAALSRLAGDRGVPIHHGRKVIGSKSAPGGAELDFEDGSSAGGDLLIGADGLRSRIRADLDPDAPLPRYTGMGNVGALTRSTSVDVGAEAADGDYRMIWGRRCFFGYTVSPDGEIWWFANPPARRELSREELAAADPEDLKRELVELLSVDKGPAAAIVAGTVGPIHRSNQYELPRVPTWHRDRRIIIGDAAHAVSPATGQGVSLACEDAVTLAGCLRAAKDLESALEDYERSRRPRVDRVARWGAKMGANKTVGPFGRILRDLVLPRILAKGSTPEAMEKQQWLFSHHIDWEVQRPDRMR